jgi:hypothetical protein
MNQPMDKKARLRILIGSVAVFVAVMAIATVLTGREKKRFRTEGALAQAEVLDKYQQLRQTSSRNTTTLDRCFRLRFQVGGKTVQGQTCDYVLQELYDTIAVGSKVDVLYLRDSLVDNPDGTRHAGAVVLKRAVSVD